MRIEYISRKLGSKTIFWFQKFNKYLLVDFPVNEIIYKLCDGSSIKTIENWCYSNLKLSNKDCNKYISGIKLELQNLKSKTYKKEFININYNTIQFENTKFFNICNTFFHFEFESFELESLIIPPFTHFQINGSEQNSIPIKIFNYKNQVVLNVNEETIGSWGKSNIHYLTGKISMIILQKIQDTVEDEWLGVFHASAITDGVNSILFLGSSGSGKSTLSAFLMAHGLKVLADDFLPIKASTIEACHFPSAISLKRPIPKYLTEFYPELNYTDEYIINPSKTVQYLPNPISNENPLLQAPVKALVFVQYNKSTDLQFSKMDKEKAFSKLVTDSWISQIPDNVEKFLNWFVDLPCYQMKYSDNSKMVQKIKTILEDSSSKY